MDRKKRIRKADILLIVGLLIFAVLGFVVRGIIRTKEAGEIVISIDGTEYGRYDLNEDQVIMIHDSNKVVIMDGEAFMEEANCPDQLCMDMPAISKTGDSIICLPNHIVVKVENAGDQSDLDSLAE